MSVDPEIMGKLRLNNAGGVLQDVIAGYEAGTLDVGVAEFTGIGLQTIRDAVTRQEIALEDAMSDEERHHLGRALERSRANLAKAEAFYARPRFVITQVIGRFQDEIQMTVGMRTGEPVSGKPADAHCWDPRTWGH